MKKNAFTDIRRMALNAVLVTIYIVLSTYLSISLGPFKLTFEAMPVVLCAVIFGPVDAMIVGFLGEFLNQMLTFGFTPTTLLWVAPIVVRGGVIGLFMMLMRKNYGLETMQTPKCYVLFLIVCIVAGLFHSLINTFALYVDSKMFGYYNDYMVFGALLVRLTASTISAIVMSVVTVPLAMALRKARLIS